MTDIQKHEIDEYGLDRNSCAGLSLSKEKQDKAEHFRIHLERMKNDEEYRMKWTIKEQEYQAAIKENLYY